MKLVTFAREGRHSVGVALDEGRLVDVEAASEGTVRGALAELLPDTDAMQRIAEVAALVRDGSGIADDAVVRTDAVQLLAPIPRPGKIICLGRNYADHAAESGTTVPAWPCIFSKPASAVIGEAGEIRMPHVSAELDFEVELAVVIGCSARDVREENAYDYVAGYTVLNDVSVRDYQRIKGGGQWTLGKSFDTCCPIGPWLVTRDEIPDPHDLCIRCDVSGKQMQLAHTSQMIFRVPFIIQHLSACMTLEPGDIIATGTPAGVGFARKPPRFLRVGDKVECTVERIGTLTNHVV